ncbi:hypothetical protein G7B40_039825 [Aetokthonos hydrillicola Thurmond2011]|jgi:hypothetical protein|uniref:Uncharacterized protein n=1 Tax=Aetokthonos hydrillicola Thurmond2011 TaxID=2712845 RepID=A0AAP5IFF9_9CYAN|nr:hypothetical protein [Aetokthonos hydrillicola]MBW4590129.1 hypothetical protein [Aetokthonos hydrillicola CCALA 1050]MDR9900640.1 hypothetical protein [Aetokthonos hydrillicola Thurmond2011]
MLSRRLQIVLFTLFFGIISTTKNISDASEPKNLNNNPLFQKSIIAQKEQSTSRKNVGIIECNSISLGDSSQDSQKNIIKAILLNNASGGFIFKMRLAGRNDDSAWNVTPNLIVKEARYARQDSKMNLQPNGSFSFIYMPTSRKVCEIKGVLTFEKGVKEKIF